MDKSESCLMTTLSQIMTTLSQIMTPVRGLDISMTLVREAKKENDTFRFSMKYNDTRLPGNTQNSKEFCYREEEVNCYFDLSERFPIFVAV